MKLLLRLGTLPLLLASASCSTDAPVDPSAVAQYSFSASKLEQLARYQGGAHQPGTEMTVQMIGPEGGAISLDGFQIVVPAGAVERVVPFSIRLPVDPRESEFVRAILGPHREFLVPVTIRLPLKGTTSEGDNTVRVLWWSGADWIPLESRVTEDGRIEAQTSHFSEFGLESSLYKGVILGNRPCGSACAK